MVVGVSDILLIYSTGGHTPTIASTLGGGTPAELRGMFRCSASLAIPHLRSLAAIPCVSLPKESFEAIF